DLEFLRTAARQASVAVMNAFLYEEVAGQERLKHELSIARRIQMESLPQHTPAIRGLDIAGVSIPAWEVGGDYFDYLNGSVGSLTVIVGDVSGKGTSAALYMSKIQGILRSLHGFVPSPRDLFIRANQLLWTDLEKKSFITAIGASFSPDSCTLKIARAGHLPLFAYRASSGETERITPRGIGLGLSNGDLFAEEIEEQTLRFQPGDVFLFVSDGITEGTGDEGEEFGELRLREVLKTTALENAGAIKDAVLNAVRDFTHNGAPHDDQTVVVVKISLPLQN
ncbi:MAG: PP2C family protein-serine/threonine phosphatase, partial [Ignavibacteria bacterium]|nr:PP2C family protein-serine/threonine phosphatase [Ignavibacteria bacterium]